MKDYLQYLDPKVVDKLGRLQLKARLVVEGFLQGAHHSPYRGVSVEFAEHREYTAGDDLRHLDWKLLGRTDRYYIKQYEEETNLRCVVALDVSGSMRFPESFTRYRYGVLVAAALGFLLLRQRDAAGLALFDSQVRTFIEPRNNPAHLADIIAGLERGVGEEAQKTSLLPVFSELAERVHKRSMVVVISDFFAPVDDTLKGLARLRSRNDDVLVFHLLSPEELTFEFSQHTLYRFHGLEDLGQITVDPRAIKSEYLEAMNTFRRDLQRGCLKERVDYQMIDTSTSLEVPLAAALARRMRVRNRS